MLRKLLIKHNFSLHPYLKKNLQKMKLFPLTPMQQEVLALAENKNNILINQNTGSGKTLCYLVPLLNRILNNKRQDKDKPWGGLILTLTKELGIQIYRQVRLLDPDNLIKISRIGSIAHFSGIVEKLNKKTQTSANLDQIVKENVINTINWNNWDIVVSTPHSLIHAIGKQQKLLKPQLVVIDEADMLLAIDQNIASVTKTIIKKNIPQNKNSQFILASSSFPPKMAGKQSDTALNSMFPDIKVVKSSTKHKLPKTLKVQFVDTSKFNGQSKDEVLTKIVSNLMSLKKSKIIIFCNSLKIVQQVSKYLSKNNIKSNSLTANLSSQSRADILSAYQRGQFDILVATNLVSRGFDLNIDAVIEYNMATNVVDYINRAGRTARFGKEGTIISFIEEQDRMLFKIIKQKMQRDQSLDQAFSRKRSLSKTMKKYQQDSNNDTL